MNTTTTPSRSYDRVREFLLSEVWAMDERYVRLFASLVDERMSGAVREFEAANGDRKVKPEEDRGFRMMGDVAVVPIVGPITRRAGLFSRMSGMTSVESIRAGLRGALAEDPAAVILHMDSPGGGVSGIAELGTEVFESREGRPIVALADGMMASAAYWIGSQADEVYATEGSQVGSIGVYAQIVSDDRAMKNKGFDPITIRSSELKGIGAGPITPRQEDALRAQVARFFDMFKGAVSRGRPGMDVEAAATGLVYLPGQAAEMGLIDGVTTLEQLAAKLG